MSPVESASTGSTPNLSPASTYTTFPDRPVTPSLGPTKLVFFPSSDDWVLGPSSPGRENVEEDCFAMTSFPGSSDDTTVYRGRKSSLKGIPKIGRLPDEPSCPKDDGVSPPEALPAAVCPSHHTMSSPLEAVQSTYNEYPRARRASPKTTPLSRSIEEIVRTTAPLRKSALRRTDSQSVYPAQLARPRILSRCGSADSQRTIRPTDGFKPLLPSGNGPSGSEEAGKPLQVGIPSYLTSSSSTFQPASTPKAASPTSVAERPTGSGHPQSVTPGSTALEPLTAHSATLQVSPGSDTTHIHQTMSTGQRRRSSTALESLKTVLARQCTSPEQESALERLVQAAKRAERAQLGTRGAGTPSMQRSSTMPLPTSYTESYRHAPPRSPSIHRRAAASNTPTLTAHTLLPRSPTIDTHVVTPPECSPSSPGDLSVPQEHTFDADKLTHRLRTHLGRISFAELEGVGQPGPLGRAVDTHPDTQSRIIRMKKRPSGVRRRTLPSLIGE